MTTTAMRQPDGPAGMSHLQRALVLVLALILAACSGGMGGGSMDGTGSAATNPGGSSAQGCSGSCGTALVTLTDAPGDFVSYIVNIVSLTLTRSDGTVVQTVPTTTQVDLAQLVNLSEILSADQVPAGRYVSVALTVDYSGATIVVDNGSDTGVTIAPGDIINGVTSEPLAAPNPTRMTLTLSLASDQQLVITPNAIANLSLDFNLAASNTVGPSTTNPTTVTVNPVVTASLAADPTLQMRVRGPLISVNTTAGSYLIGVLPFYQPFTSSSSTAGQFTVTTTSATSYAINGSSYTGSAGLTALAAVSAGTLTVAYGSWDQSTQSFIASQVLAGSSVGGTNEASVQGTVLSRSGDTLTLANGLLLHPNIPGIAFMGQLTATIGGGTSVLEQGQSGSFTIADISVGQHLTLFGSLSSPSMGSVTLDASSGGALLQPTPVLGTVTAAASGLITLNLQSLGGRPPSAFNFAGTGSDSSNDATATAYTVAVPASLSTSSLSVGAPASFTGFVAPFGAAPPDFAASTLVSYAQTAGALQVRWNAPGVTAPFATLTGSELLISQATLQSSSEDVIQIASVDLNPSTLSGGLELVPDASASATAFAIVHRSQWMIDTYGTFNDLVSALTSDLTGTTTALEVAAYGPYDASTGVLSVEQLVVILDQ